MDVSMRSLDGLDNAIFSLIATSGLRVGDAELSIRFIPEHPRKKQPARYPMLSFQPLKPESASSRRFDTDDVVEYDSDKRLSYVRTPPIWYNLPYNIQYVDDIWYRWRSNYMFVLDPVFPYVHGGRNVLLEYKRYVTIEVQNVDENLDTHLFGVNYLLTVHDVPLFTTPPHINDVTELQSVRRLKIFVGDLDSTDLTDSDQADSLESNYS